MMLPGKIARNENTVALVGNISASAFGIVILMGLARSLSLSDFGKWTMFLAASGLIELIRTGLSRQALVYSLSREEDELRQMAIARSSWHLAFIVTLTLAAVLVSFYFLLHDLAMLSTFYIFLKWYPLLLVVTLPHNMDTWLSQAEKKFSRMNKIRLAVNIIFSCFLATTYLFYPMTIEITFFCYFVAHLLVSLSSIIYRSEVILHYKSGDPGLIKDQLNFGKHSLMTMAGVNLLKSSDQLLIGAFMGPAAAALYAIPIKILDILEIPLRGFAMTSFPKMVKAFTDRDIRQFTRIFYDTTSGLLLFSAAVGLSLFFFPQFFITILGGNQFLKADDVVRVFSFAALIVPLEKLLGIALDSTGRPWLNARKVWIMVGVNLIGDCIVIYFFKSLEAVALVTIFNIMAGFYFSAVNMDFFTFSSRDLLSAIWIQMQKVASILFPSKAINR